MEEAELELQPPLGKFTGTLPNPGVHLHYRESDETHILRSCHFRMYGHFANNFSGII